MKKVNRWILALVLLSFVVGGIFLSLSPDQIPVHYNAGGQIDRWGSKYEYMVMPVLTAVFAAFMVWIARYEGKKGRPENEKVVSGMTVGVLLLFNALWAFFMIKALNTAGSGAGLGELPARGILLLVMGSFIPLGNIMPKVQRNSVLGLRTKWSMADDVCWQKSQRMGGFLMVGVGTLGVIAASVLPVQWMAHAVGVLMLGMILAAVAGTYLIWKKQQK